MFEPRRGLDTSIIVIDPIPAGGVNSGVMNLDKLCTKIPKPKLSDLEYAQTATPLTATQRTVS